MSAELLLPVVGFLGGAAVVVVAGIVLASQAGIVAERTGLGHLWTGTLLLAGATSLPELATVVSAGRAGAADLALGDLFGSGMANMLILAAIDLLPPSFRVLSRSATDHAVSAALAMSLTAVAAIFVLVGPLVTLGPVGVESLVLVAIYLAGTRAVFQQVGRRPAGPDGRERPPSFRGALHDPTIRGALLRFALAAVLLVLAAPVFTGSAARLAEVSGLSQTFVGAWLVGLSTTLPELVASITAVRGGLVDLAVGNLFGSNAYNVALVAVLDLSYAGGPVMGAVESLHAVTALLSLLLMSIGVAAIVHRPGRRRLVLDPDAPVLVLTYLLGILLLYSAGGA